MRRYDYLDSGNGYKVRLLLSHLAIPFELVEMDIMQGETHTNEFLAKNPNGKILLIETDEGGFDLSAHPATRKWLGRVAAQPGHVSIVPG